MADKVIVIKWNQRDAHQVICGMNARRADPGSFAMHLIKKTKC